jgi:integrase
MELPSTQNTHKVLLSTAIEDTVKFKCAANAKSTNTAFTNKAKQLIKWFGHYSVADMTSRDVLEIRCFLIDNYVPKTMNHYSDILRATFERLKKDSVIEIDFTPEVKTLRTITQKQPTYLLSQIKPLLVHDEAYETEILLLRFALLTGLRIGELLAISVEAYNKADGEFNVEITLSGDEYKAPKSILSKRPVFLDEQGILTLERLIFLAGDRSAKLVDVTLEDNRTIQRQSRTFLAFSTFDGRLFKDTNDFRNNFYIDHCIARDVDYLPPKNLRNTYASQLLTKGVPIAWIAQQMGHTNKEMVEKYYGSWLKVDGKETTDKVNEHFCEYFDSSNTEAANDKVFIKQDELKTSWFRNLFNKIFSKAA